MIIVLLLCHAIRSFEERTCRLSRGSRRLFGEALALRTLHSFLSTQHSFLLIFSDFLQLLPFQFQLLVSLTLQLRAIFNLGRPEATPPQVKVVG